MEGCDPNIQVPLDSKNPQIHRDSIHNRPSLPSSYSASLPSSPPGFLQNVHAAFKRHRPLVSMQSVNIHPMRAPAFQREPARCLVSNSGSPIDTEISQDAASLIHDLNVKKSTSCAKNTISICGVIHDDVSVMPPSILESQHVPTDDVQKDLFTMGKRASTEALQNTDLETNMISRGVTPYTLAKRTNDVRNRLSRIGTFLCSESNHPMTQSLASGPSCATTTLIHSSSAPISSLTAYGSSCLQPNASTHVGVESYGGFEGKCQVINHRDMQQPLNSSQDSSYVIDGKKEYFPYKEHGCGEIKQSDDVPDVKSIKETGFDLTDIQSEAPSSKNTLSDVKLEPYKLAKQEKDVGIKGTAAPRKRSYNPDLYFKVNGKLYQRLGKIGSGGSSEVHKVISSDCTIYALKKIKLKGRDYSTAYGFCQEIEYLSKLKRKDYIIQLIDYEVTDKTLFQAVISGSLSKMDGRVRDDGYIYMVLEYGEIDLAHMLSQKWKQIDGSGQTIDDNWLRFHWQQMLQAVNTIHEERIIHSDLKPANFLQVKGSLKLIDFGIAKAINSDTTNIQRDSQVGTLSYMSPEAFMCNENGNSIKCGRSSDIWSLGCILYQMVYGRTPFSEYTLFWEKFKVITDRNHKINYGPLPNPWLLDLMKKCLVWDRSDRWRIPELLNHPFLIPPVPPRSPEDQSYNLLQLVAVDCENRPEALILYLQLKKLLTDPISKTHVKSTLSEISKCCCLLQQHLGREI